MPVLVKIDQLGVEALIASTDEGLGKYVANVEAAAVRLVPVKTGQLRASIRSEVVGPVGRVYCGTDHWAATEFGSAPHTITAHGNYSLHNAESGAYFGPVVHHPGTPSQPFMRPALYRAQL